VRANFCVSKVGMIVSSSGVGVVAGLGEGVGVNVCAWVAAENAKIENAIHRSLQTRAYVILVNLRKSAVSVDKSMLL
jgi:hypothetical protein